MNDEREYLAATLWTPADWGRDRSGDWATAVRIGEPLKEGGREVIKPSLTTATAPAQRDKSNKDTTKTRKDITYRIPV